MNKKLALIGGALALACLSSASYADSVGNSSHGTIVVISKEETGIPEYFHQKYVFNHPDCEGSVPVDFYGPEINPNDSQVLAAEQRMCAQNRWFGDGSGGGDSD
jgi:hypothetical protein